MIFDDMPWYVYCNMLLPITHERARARYCGGNAIARGLEKDPSGDVYALQACGIDAASHLEA